MSFYYAQLTSMTNCDSEFSWREAHVEETIKTVLGPAYKSLGLTKDEVDVCSC